jgi:hypothetical protein
MYIGYSFLSISNKFCDLNLLHWVIGGGGGSVEEKFPAIENPKLVIYKTNVI